MAENRDDLDGQTLLFQISLTRENVASKTPRNPQRSSLRKLGMVTYSNSLGNRVISLHVIK